MLPHCSTAVTIGQRLVCSRGGHDEREYHVPDVDALGWYRKL